MIPRKIHYCWFGGGEKPEIFTRCMESWKRFCPDYEIVEWNESNYDVNRNLYTRLAYKRKQWAFVSDYARIDLVYRSGGFYLDTDVELQKKLDSLRGHSLYFGIEQENRKINSGLGFGAAAGHPFLNRLLCGYDLLAEEIAAGKADFGACPVMETSLLKTYGFRERDVSQKLSDGIRVYSSEYFCPKTVSGRMKRLTPRTYSIHHYNASWIRDKKWYRLKLHFSKELAVMKKIMVCVMGEERFRGWRNRSAGAAFPRPHGCGEERFRGWENRSRQRRNRQVHRRWEKRTFKNGEKGSSEEAGGCIENKKKELVILTPTYNRAHKLPRLYESLKAQTDHNFRWLVCDDGSQDETPRLAAGWAAKEHEFAVDYYRRRENGGKHRAVNDAMRYIREDYVCIVDSDDYLLPDAVRKIHSWILEVDADERFAGVAGLRGCSAQKKIGEFPPRRAYVDATNLERRRSRLRGDKAEVYRTALLKKYPFPVFENEKFLAESAVWDRIAAEGKMLRWHNSIIYITEYLPDGLTKDLRKDLDNFQGFTYNKRLGYRLKKFPENICELARYIQTADKKNLSKADMLKNMGAGEAEYLLARAVGAVRGRAVKKDYTKKTRREYCEFICGKDQGIS